MTESFKIPSKITNLIVFIAAFIVYIGRDGLLQILPEQLAYLAPIIVLIAGYIATQKTEDKRVERAEQLAVENHIREEKTAEYDEIFQQEDVDELAEEPDEDLDTAGEDDDE